MGIRAGEKYMKSVDCRSDVWMHFICSRIGYVPTGVAQCILCLENGVPIAGVVYDGYNVKSITCHIWIEKGKIPSKEWYAAIFDYPFNALKVTKLVGASTVHEQGCAEPR
jgi:uncharacterized metal-binding protein